MRRPDMPRALARDFRRPWAEDGRPGGEVASAGGGEGEGDARAAAGEGQVDVCLGGGEGEVREEGEGGVVCCAAAEVERA